MLFTFIDNGTFRKLGDTDTQIKAFSPDNISYNRRYTIFHA